MANFVVTETRSDGNGPTTAFDFELTENGTPKVFSPAEQDAIVTYFQQNNVAYKKGTDYDFTPDGRMVMLDRTSEMPWDNETDHKNHQQTINEAMEKGLDAALSNANTRAPSAPSAAAVQNGDFVVTETRSDGNGPTTAFDFELTQNGTPKVFTPAEQDAIVTYFQQNNVAYKKGTDYDFTPDGRMVMLDRTSEMFWDNETDHKNHQQTINQAMKNGLGDAIAQASAGVSSPNAPAVSSAATAPSPDAPATPPAAPVASTPDSPQSPPSASAAQPDALASFAQMMQELQTNGMTRKEFTQRIDQLQDGLSDAMANENDPTKRQTISAAIKRLNGFEADIRDGKISLPEDNANSQTVSGAGDQQRDPWAQIISLLVEALTGRKIEEQEYQVSQSQNQETPAPTQETPAPTQETPAPTQETPAPTQETPIAAATPSEPSTPAAPATPPTSSDATTGNNEQDEQKNLMEAKDALKEAIKQNMLARTGQEPSPEAVEKEANAVLGSLTSADANKGATLADETQGLKDKTAELEQNTQAVGGYLAAVAARAEAQGKSADEVVKEVDEARKQVSGMATDLVLNQTAEVQKETKAVNDYVESAKNVARAEGRDDSEIEGIADKARKESVGKSASDLEGLTRNNEGRIEKIDAYVKSAEALATAEGREFDETSARKGTQTKGNEDLAADTGKMDTRTAVIEENVAAYKTQLEMTGVIGDEQSAKIAERRASFQDNAEMSNDAIASLTGLDKDKNAALKALSDKEGERADFLIANKLMPEGLTKEQYVGQIMSEAGKRSTGEILAATTEATTELQDAQERVSGITTRQGVIAAEEKAIEAKVAAGQDPSYNCQAVAENLQENQKGIAELIAAAGGISSFKVAGVGGGIESDFALKSPQAIGGGQDLGPTVASAGP